MLLYISDDIWSVIFMAAIVTSCRSFVFVFIVECFTTLAVSVTCYAYRFLFICILYILPLYR